MMIDALTKDCPTLDIAAYIDGELTPSREIEMDMHFANCGPCQSELNEQKRFLHELESSLHYEQPIELPPNFTKQVVANAESSVSGLRRPSERYNALFICVSLGLFVLFASGLESDKVIAGIIQVADQCAAVGSFFGHLIYSLFLGIVIVLRTIGSNGNLGALSILALLSISVLILTAVSKRILRMRRI
jgi:anti-sigma factor RsiW